MAEETSVTLTASRLVPIVLGALSMAGGATFVAIGIGIGSGFLIAYGLLGLGFLWFGLHAVRSGRLRLSSQELRIFDTHRTIRLPLNEVVNAHVESGQVGLYQRRFLVVATVSGAQRRFASFNSSPRREGVVDQAAAAINARLSSARQTDE
ncbi:MAG TPA: hypothetical protein VIJ47_06890 [Acidimicrobiales bacterium]